MLKALDYCRKFIYTVLLLLFVALIFDEFKDIRHATQTLLYKADQLTSLEMPGAKIVFTSERVDAGFSALNMDSVPAEQRSHAQDFINQLNQAEFMRLMYVGQLTDLCEYEKPVDLQTRYDVANDYNLVEMKLAKMTDNLALLGDKQREYAAGHYENGKPFHCYHMELTGAGWDVKTALVGGFGEMFKGADKTIPFGQHIALN
jgi:hypothetical protein